jgi:protease-4
MTSRSKALLVIFILLLLLVGGPLGVYFVARSFARHVPGNGLLALEISGELPELTVDSPFAGVLVPRVVSLQDVRDALVKAKSDPKVLAVRVRVGDLAAGLASLQEVRELLIAVGKAGKQTHAFLETAGEGTPGNAQYYLASACQTVVLGPLGDVNLTMPGVRVPFIRGMLDKLGIEPEVPGIGAYKTARFFFTERDFTPEDREMTGWLADSVYRQLAGGIAEARKMEPSLVETLFRTGPFVGQQALELSLVDRIEDWSAFAESTKEGPHGRLEEISLARYLRAGRPDRSGATIAVVVAGGQVMRGESGYSPVPLFGGDVMGSETIARAWRLVRDSNAKAAIFRIDSPGGSAIASEVIRVEMARTAEHIPVIVSMSNVAASGGYWITCGASKVIANPGTITASIGVFSGHFAMERFWTDKLGVSWGKIDKAPNSGLYDSLSPWSPEQRQINQRFLDNIYEQFTSRVAEARKMERAEVDAVGRGRVFTGEQALNKGLIDALGGFEVALVEARRAANLADGAPVELVFYPHTRQLWQQLLSPDEEARLGYDAALKALVDGRIKLPGPVWMPPIAIE